ncbi:uncharacterized protein [Apostichopus japonicus]|uniref:uncharacterized protein n=1 Tax=Stichopus japonicus TaxID=307972 RepID=UPI003AB2062E
MTDAGKLCDFAAKFPCKGSHCLPSPCTSKTSQESKEPTTGVTIEPQGTTLGTTEETIKPSTTELPTTTSPGTTEETIKPSTTELSTTTSPGTAQHTIKPSTTESPTTTPPVLYSDCKEVYDAGYTQDGVYKILPAGWPGSAFHVYCKMDNGGGWTIFTKTGIHTRSALVMSAQTFGLEMTKFIT